jgi:hypothetical protein
MLADEPAVARDTVLRRMMHPKSVAIIGMSAKSNTAGHAVLRNWRLNGFAGDIHLIGRTVGEITNVLPRVNDLSHDDGLFMEYLNTSMARPPETIERLKAFLEKRAKPLAKPERESS